MEYIQIQKGNDAQFRQLLDMWIPYFREIGSTESDTAIAKYARQRVAIQGNWEDMHFELSFVNSTMVGFCFYAVDLGGIRNVLPPDLGYIMEFYVLPQYRRQGYGSEMYRHVEATFSKHGAESIYLTPDKTSGEAFWVSLGFVDSGKVDPDNHLPILIKKIGHMSGMRAWDPEDYDRVSRLGKSEQEFSLHSVDGPYRLALARSGDPSWTQLCEDEQGNLLGWAMLGTWQFLDVVVADSPEGREVEPLLVRWGKEAWARGPGRHGRHLWAPVHDSDHRRQELLVKAGFEQDDWSLRHMMRYLASKIPDVTLPQGFSVRPVQGPGEAQSVAALHREAFSSDLMTDEWRIEILNRPEYRQDLDLVAVAPDGQLAGYCLLWLNGADGQVEPLAVHPRYRRLGLATALLCEGFRRLASLNAVRVHVEYVSFEERAESAYRSVGFEPAYRILQYCWRA